MKFFPMRNIYLISWQTFLTEKLFNCDVGKLAKLNRQNFPLKTGVETLEELPAITTIDCGWQESQNNNRFGECGRI
jgi:hypothetical protein